MTIPARKPVAAPLAALALAALIAILVTPMTATATPLRIGEFFFDLPDGSTPVVHVTNESTDLFTSFTLEIINDVTFDDGTTGVDTQAITSSLLAGDAFQVLPTDLAPLLSFVTPRTGRMSQFVFSQPGSITFSPDGGTTFLTSAVLDLLAEESGFGIYFEEPQATDPSPVPEPGTLLLLASGLAASRRRRILGRFAAIVTTAAGALRSPYRSTP